MNPTIKHMLFVAAASVSLFSCKKDRDIIPQQTTAADSAVFNKLMQDGLNSITETTTLTVPSKYTWVSYKSANGPLLMINGDGLRKNGTLVSGKVLLSFTVVNDRKSMIIANKPNMAITTSGTYEMLANSTAYNISITQDDVAITTDYYHNVEISNPATAPYMDDTLAYNGKVFDNNLSWAPTNQWKVNVSGKKYYMGLPGNGWYAIGKTNNDNRPKTRITVNIPDGYANASRVYIIPKGTTQSVGAVWGTYPVGMDCYVLFLTERNGQYCWIAKETTITNNHIENIDINNAQNGTLADFGNYLSQLN